MLALFKMLGFIFLIKNLISLKYPLNADMNQQHRI